MEDLPRLHVWLNRPHVLEFYGQRRVTPEEVRRKYEPRLHPESRVQPWIVLVDDRPAGYVQWYWLRDHPPGIAGWCDLDGAAGLDVFLGEPTLLGQGVGSAAINDFIRDVLVAGHGVTRVLIDPAVTNVRAIRAYEKVGFRRLSTFEAPNPTSPCFMLFEPPERPCPHGR